MQFSASIAAASSLITSAHSSTIVIPYQLRTPTNRHRKMRLLAFGNAYLHLRRHCEAVNCIEKYSSFSNSFVAALILRLTQATRESLNLFLRTTHSWNLSQNEVDLPTRLTLASSHSTSNAPCSRFSASSNSAYEQTYLTQFP